MFSDAAIALLPATCGRSLRPRRFGRAGVHAQQRRTISAQVARSRPVPPLPDVDLSEVIENALTGSDVEFPIVEPDGQGCEGALFITDDEITASLPPAPAQAAQEEHSYQEFAVYQAVVEAVREGNGGKGPVALPPGSVKQPNHVRCVRTRDYKLARCFDPSGKVPQEWEMYDLHDDPNEAVNLVEVSVSPPRALGGLPDAAEVQAAADRLAALLARLERPPDRNDASVGIRPPACRIRTLKTKEIIAARRADWYARRDASGTRHAAAREINEIPAARRPTDEARLRAAGLMSRSQRSMSRPATVVRRINRHRHAKADVSRFNDARY
jgi:hypothetical protein